MIKINNLKDLLERLRQALVRGTEFEVAGLLFYGEEQVRPHERIQVRPRDEALQSRQGERIILRYSEMAQYWNTNPRITKAAAEALLRAFRDHSGCYFSRRQSRDVWEKLFNLFRTVKPHLKAPYVQYLEDFCRKLLSWISYHDQKDWWWDDDFCDGLLPAVYQLIVELGFYWLLYESRETGAVGVLTRKIFDLQSVTSGAGDIEGLQDALVDYNCPDRQEGAKVLCLLLVLAGGLQYKEVPTVV